MPDLTGLSEDELRSLVLSVGTHRSDRPLSPVEVGELFEKACDEGASMSECAAATQLNDETMVRRFLRLNHIDERIRHLVDWGESDEYCISFSAGVELSRLPNEAQVELGEAVVENSLTKKEVVSIRQLYERSGDSLTKCIQRVLKRRPVQRKVDLVMGAIVDGELEKVLSTKSQRERNRVLEEALDNLVSGAPIFSARLGTQKFTIAGQQGVVGELEKLENPEASVSQEVARLLGVSGKSQDAIGRSDSQ